MLREGRILLADDHPIVAEGLSLAIRARHPKLVIDSAESVAAAETLARRNGNYRLMLLDYRLPDADGYSGFFRLQHVLGRIPIAFISAFTDARLIEAARAIGAAGFISKSQPLEQLAASVERLLAGHTIFPASGETDSTLVQLRERIGSLSPAQMRVLSALARGRSNKQIAADLDLSEATIKAHMSAVFRKLGVYNRLQAMLAVAPLFDSDEAAP